MVDLFEEFYQFCVNPNKPSGKARSYSNAIKYLCEYLKIKEVTMNTIKNLLELETDIQDNNSKLYKDLLEFLKDRNQISYLTGRYIRAAYTPLKAFYNQKIHLNVLNSPIFFAHITWMKRYDGIEPFKKNGMSWIKEHNDAGEKFNFRECHGYNYGFVQCKNSKINLETIAKTYGCKIESLEGNKYIQNMLVVFFATEENGGSKIVGFYKNATVFEKPQINEILNSQYYFRCNSKNAFLIPEGERNFIIPKSENGVNYYGQDLRWYAEKQTQLPFLIKVVNYIKKIQTDEIIQEPVEIIFNSSIDEAKLLAKFDLLKLKHLLPIANRNNEHAYHEKKISGTLKESFKRAYSGRRAEKYFIEFLKIKNLIEGQDFYDVANDKNYGYDVQFSDIGLEIKNVRSGSFYLSDNEIALLQNKKTHLILVDIDNGIWLLQNNSIWLKNVIQNIIDIREYSAENYKLIDLTDIRILIDNDIKQEIKEITDFSTTELINVLLN